MRKLIIALALTGMLLISSGLTLLIYNLKAPDYPIVRIHPDGTIEPSSTPISREGNLYSLEADITLYKLLVERSNMTLDGKGFKIRITSPNGTKVGPGLGSLELANVENVTLRNIITGYPQVTANNFYENYPGAILIFENSSFCDSVSSKFHSIRTNNCDNIIVSENNVLTGRLDGGIIQLTNSRNCNISSCTNLVITLYNSHENMILNNDMTEMKPLALRIEDSDSNLFFGNRIERTIKLFEITGSSADNLFVGNYIQGAFSIDPILDCSGVNTFYHNNFVYVYWNKNLTNHTPNLWDNGSEGNYWNDYQGIDNNGDGIGDSPHLIDYNNQDRYPLMNPVDLSSEPLPQGPK